MLAAAVRQAVLGGRTAGLRPAQRRRLERLSQRRHPADALADPLTLQRLAVEADDLELPLSLLVDSRGLCRLLWVGPLERSGPLLDLLAAGSSRRRSGQRRLLSCTGPQGPLEPQAAEAIVALDLGLALWLRFTMRRHHGGHRQPAHHGGAGTGCDLLRTTACESGRAAVIRAIRRTAVMG